VLDETTGYSLELALRSARVAVEVDGPSHFLLCHDGSDEHLPNGKTLLKRRLLKAAGWRLVSVPFHDWDALLGREKQCRYLSRRLSEVGLVLTGGQ